MKQRTAILAIAGMLLLGVGAFAQQQPPAKPQKPAPQGQTGDKPQGRPDPMARLADYLKLTPEQIQKIKDVQKTRQDQQKAFRDQMQKLRGDLRPLLRDEKADPAKANGLIDQIAKLGADRAKQVLAGRGGLQKVLTPEQADKLKNAPPAMRQRLMNFFRGQGMGQMGRGQGMGPGGQGQPGMGMRGQGMGPGMRAGQGGMGMGWGMGMRGQGQMMGRGILQRLMQRFPILRRLLQMRRMGGRFANWW